MFVKEMGKKKPKGIKVGMTRAEAELLRESLVYVCSCVPGAWRTQTMDEAVRLHEALARVINGT
jgi:hypothetical protein